MVNRRNIAYVLVIVWMMVIFGLSAQVRDKSDRLSSGITKVVVDTAKKVSPEKKLNFNKVNHIIRKNAHFFAYLVLGMLLMVAAMCSGIKGYRAVTWALFICVVYAISDEIHQAFVPGRGPGVKDVIIDSAGAIVGIIILRVATIWGDCHLPKSDCHQSKE